MDLFTRAHAELTAETSRTSARSAAAQVSERSSELRSERQRRAPMSARLRARGLHEPTLPSNAVDVSPRPRFVNVPREKRARPGLSETFHVKKDHAILCLSSRLLLVPTPTFD